MTRIRIESKMTRKILLTVLLLALGWACVGEMREALAIQRNWDVLLSPLHLLTIAAAALLLLGGLAALLLSIWGPDEAGRLPLNAGHLRWFRWAALAACLGFVIWFFLYSPWQVVFTGLWTRTLFLLGMAQLAALSAGREENPPDWHILVLALAWLGYLEAVNEVRLMTPLAVIYRGVTLIGAVLAAGVAIFLYHLDVFPKVQTRLSVWRDRMAVWRNQLTAWRDCAGWLRWLFGILLACAPLLLLYLEGRENYAAYLLPRLSVFLLALVGLAVLVSKEKKQLVTPEGWITAAGLLLFATVISNRLTGVTAYPFSLGWSEGNRFYDYSLTFASNLYNYPGKLEVPYFSPGRYALWGSLFLIPGLPIWAHRLWNVFLLTVPALTVGWLLARPVRTSRLFPPFLLWMTLYLLQGPVLPPLLVALTLFLPFLFVRNPWVRAASLVATSLAAGLSRFTWAVGPGAWGALADLLLYYPQRKGNFLQRIWPTAALALLGVLPGILASWGNVWNRSSDIIGKQPLLWYRLWANATYPAGILPGILLASGPLVVLLVWLAATRRWKMDWVQAAAAAGASLAFLGAGIIMSMKIGGGGDLHNLDLYLLTIALLAGLAAHALHRDGRLAPAAWPRRAQAVLALFLLIPAWNAWRVTTPAFVPSAETTNASLNFLQATVKDYQDKGEILFMDQRQLLTFGFIKDVPFTPDYEKKYMMDQAMGGNAAYFASYYRDLANRRFALIITEPLKINYAGRTKNFGEENDAWVQWVSVPTLCFYQPLITLQDAGVQLLTPRENTEACAQYLNP
ncbi:MAG: hypothetical protein FD146_362 [Anaerolineaceae bacterium]|nr:MAG: hypothetical protein FD146_362 [Anaerolineaceae bacterium]